MSNMIDIKAPNLLNANFGANVKQQFDNINSNFQKLSNYDFTKGEPGENVMLYEVNIQGNYEIGSFEKIVVDNFKKSLKEYSGISDNKYNWDIINEEWENIYNQMVKDNVDPEILDNIFPVVNDEVVSDNILDSGFENGIIYLIIRTSPNKELTISDIVSSLPITFLDRRFYHKNLSNTLSVVASKEYNPYDNAIDLSCVCYAENSENGFSFKVVSTFPTLYYDEIIGNFCWKWQGNETGVVANGPRGATGSTSKVVIAQCSTIKQNEFNELVVFNVEGQKVPIDQYQTIKNYYNLSGIDSDGNEIGIKEMSNWPVIILNQEYNTQSQPEQIDENTNQNIGGFYISTIQYSNTDDVEKLSAYCSNDNYISSDFSKANLWEAMMEMYNGDEGGLIIEDSCPGLIIPRGNFTDKQNMHMIYADYQLEGNQINAYKERNTLSISPVKLNPDGTVKRNVGSNAISQITDPDCKLDVNYNTTINGAMSAKSFTTAGTMSAGTMSAGSMTADSLTVNGISQFNNESNFTSIKASTISNYEGGQLNVCDKIITSENGQTTIQTPLHIQNNEDKILSIDSSNTEGSQISISNNHMKLGNTDGLGTLGKLLESLDEKSTLSFYLTWSSNQADPTGTASLTLKSQYFINDVITLTLNVANNTLTVSGNNVTYNNNNGLVTVQLKNYLRENPQRQPSFKITANYSGDILSSLTILSSASTGLKLYAQGASYTASISNVIQIYNEQYSVSGEQIIFDIDNYTRVQGKMPGDYDVDIYGKLNALGGYDNNGKIISLNVNGKIINDTGDVIIGDNLDVEGTIKSKSIYIPGGDSQILLSNGKMTSTSPIKINFKDSTSIATGSWKNDTGGNPYYNIDISYAPSERQNIVPTQYTAQNTNDSIPVISNALCFYSKSNNILFDLYKLFDWQSKSYIDEIIKTPGNHDQPISLKVFKCGNIVSGTIEIDAGHLKYTHSGMVRHYCYNQDTSWISWTLAKVDIKKEGQVYTHTTPTGYITLPKPTHNIMFPMALGGVNANDLDTLKNTFAMGINTDGYIGIHQTAYIQELLSYSTRDGRDYRLTGSFTYISQE